MDDTPDLDIGCQEVTVKFKRSKKTKIRSKKLKKLLDILRSGEERHVIWYTEKNEFVVKMVDKKDKKLWQESDISLFLALDAVSNKPRDQKNLAEATKNRFKASMTKFVRAGYLKNLGFEKISKTVVYKKYRILKDFSTWDETDGYCQQSTSSESIGSSEDMSPSIVSSPDSACSFSSTSHYLCLSGRSVENNEYEMIPDGNEESVNILPVVNEEVVAKDYIAGEDTNLSIGTQYMNKPNWNNNEYEMIPYENEESVNILPVVNEEVVAKVYIAGEDMNLSIGTQYMNKPNWNNVGYEIMPYGNEESVNILPVVNEEVVAKDYIAGEDTNLSIGTQYMNKPNWNKSNFDDVTLFGETDHDEEILKESTNPLLSSAVVSEEKTGLISDSYWRNEYKIFSFDEDMYDSS